MTDAKEVADPIALTAEIVSAFVRNNAVQRSDLPALIESVHGALSRVSPGQVAPIEPISLVPAVSIKKSVTDDFIICLEDGKKFKSLKRHLTTLGMTPDQYREKWKLPAEYPMTASNYSAKRSALAKGFGFGRTGKKSRKPKSKKASKLATEAAS
jgi:predicted transcriptional regulator